MTEGRSCGGGHGYRRTTLLSDAPPKVPGLERGRNRRVHWSRLVGRFSHSGCLATADSISGDRGRLGAGHGAPSVGGIGDGESPDGGAIGRWTALQMNMHPLAHARTTRNATTGIRKRA